MKIIRFLVLIVLFLAACSRTPAQLGEDASPDTVPDLVGDYAINGVNSTGSEYAGTLTIQPGDTQGHYKIQWLVTGGVQVGTGVLDGNVLKVEWKSLSSVAGETSGAGSYTITVNGELYGKRTTDGIPGNVEETCYPNKKP